MKLALANINRQKLKLKYLSWLASLILHLVLIGLSFVFIYPFLYMLVTAFKSPADLNDISVTWLLNELRFANFTTAFKALNYGPRLFNTVFVVLMSVIGHILSCSFVGYGFARYRFKFKSFWVSLLILAIIIPSETIIVPIYILFSRLNVMGTYIPIIIPCFVGFGLRGALFVFVFNQFFLSLPKALEEAAAIDGAGPMRTFFSIALPNAKTSALITLVLGVVWHWNDTFEPSMFLETQDTFLLPQMLPVLYKMISDNITVETIMSETANIYNEAVVMAATILVILPLIVFYMILQSKFMVSVERSGLTG